MRDTTNLLHVGEDLSRGVRFPCFFIDAEQSRVGFHDRLEGTEPRTCAKPQQRETKIEYEAVKKEKKNNIPASRPTAESFSQFEPDALTRYLEPISPSRGQHTTTDMRVNRFASHRPVTHADRLVSNGPPPHPMTTISKLGPWQTPPPTTPLAAVEVGGGPCSSPPSKAPTLIRQNRCSRFSRCAYKSEMVTKK